VAVIKTTGDLKLKKNKRRVLSKKGLTGLNDKRKIKNGETKKSRLEV